MKRKILEIDQHMELILNQVFQKAKVGVMKEVDDLMTFILAKVKEEEMAEAVEVKKDE